MIELAAHHGNEPLKAEHIATSQAMPLKYLLGILADLRRAGMLRSQRGPDGGFHLHRPASAITVGEVFRALEGPLADVHDASLRDLTYPTPAEHLPTVWMAVRGSLRRVLDTVTIADLVTGDLPAEVDELAREYGRSSRPA